MSRALASLAVLVALLAVPVSAHALRPAPGIELSNPGKNDELGRAKAAEPRWLKLQVDWEAFEPVPQGYDVPDSAAARAMQRMREWLTAARADGARTQVIVYNAPGWASGTEGVRNDPPTPANLPAYEDFMRVLGERLGPLVDGWAPWNEPNTDLFWRNPDPAAYVALQRAAYRALRATDPTATVSSAPFAGIGGSYDYLVGAYRAGLRPVIDVLGWNAYPPTTPEARLFTPDGLPLESTLGAQQEVDRILRRYDPARKVWIGEFGWSTCVGCLPDNRVTIAQQGRYLPRAFLYFRRYASRVTVAVWFKLLDGSRDRAIWTQNSGLLRWNGSKKPSYGAFANLESRIRVPRSAMRLRLPARRNTPRGTVALTAPRLSYSWGSITLRARTSVRRGGTFLLQGYRDGRWTRMRAGRLPAGASSMRIRFDDGGQLAVRLLVRDRGASSWQVGRVTRLKGALAPTKGS